MMNRKNVNRNIECTVTQCANHSDNEKYCALESIRIGTHEKNPTLCSCTDCESFVLGNGGCKTCGIK